MPTGLPRRGGRGSRLCRISAHESPADTRVAGRERRNTGSTLTPPAPTSTGPSPTSGGIVARASWKSTHRPSCSKPIRPRPLPNLGNGAQLAGMVVHRLAIAPEQPCHLGGVENARRPGRARNHMMFLEDIDNRFSDRDGPACPTLPVHRASVSIVSSASRTRSTVHADPPGPRSGTSQERVAQYRVRLVYYVERDVQLDVASVLGVYIGRVSHTVAVSNHATRRSADTAEQRRIQRAVHGFRTPRHQAPSAARCRVTLVSPRKGHSVLPAPTFPPGPACWTSELACPSQNSRAARANRSGTRVAPHPRIGSARTRAAGGRC